MSDCLVEPAALVFIFFHFWIQNALSFVDHQLYAYIQILWESQLKTILSTIISWRCLLGQQGSSCVREWYSSKWMSDCLVEPAALVFIFFHFWIQNALSLVDHQLYAYIQILWESQLKTIFSTIISWRRLLGQLGWSCDHRSQGLWERATFWMGDRHGTNAVSEKLFCYFEGKTWTKSLMERFLLKSTSCKHLN